MICFNAIFTDIVNPLTFYFVRSSVILLLPLLEKGGFMDEWLSQVEGERIDNVSKYSIETEPLKRVAMI
jgi:hypothetical protein